MLDDLKHFIMTAISNIFVRGTELALEIMNNLFNTSINALKTEVAITPNDFDPELLEALKTISTNVVLPIAGLLITYVFVLQIIEEVTNKNRSSEWDVGSVIMLIIKTAITISLVINSFTITLAFTDVSSWMINQVAVEDIEIQDDVTDTLVESIKPEEIGNEDPPEYDYKLGDAFVTTLISLVGLIVVFIISATIYLVAWSRMIMILLYVTISPIPMSTLMSETWVNSIGQNYLRNLLALTIQGFLMLVLMIIYNGLLTRASSLISQGQTGFQSMMLLIVSMAIVVRMLLNTQSLSKSITGAS